jgi:sodium transport system permease protein
MIWHLTRKEILSTLRDTRAVLANLLIPLIVLPLVMLGMPLLLGGLFAREVSNVTEVAVSGLDNVPDALRDRLQAEALELIPSDNPSEQVQNDEFTLGLSVPADFQEALASNQASLTLFRKGGNLRSDLTAGKVRSAVSQFREARVQDAMREAGVDVAVLEAITLSEQNVSSETAAGGSVAWVIPFLLVVWTLSGGQMTAIDATAGEKERGSLESILVAPVRRRDLVTAKFLATALFGLSSALMAIVSYAFSSRLLFGGVLSRFLAGNEEIAEVFGGQITFTLSTLGLLIVTSVLVAMLVAALLIAVAMFARSYNEAQSYIAPLGLLMILPVIGLQVADFLDLGLGFYAVPLLNAMLFMTDVVQGSAELTAGAITWGSSLVYCVIMLAIANYNFNREAVIFRT